MDGDSQPFESSRPPAFFTAAAVGGCSVAGGRARDSNCVYGSVKAGFAALLSGLRNRLTVTPGEAAAGIRAIRRRRDVVYVRRIRRPIVFIVRAVPERVFKSMKL